MVTLELISAFNLTEAEEYFPNASAIAVHEDDLFLAADYVNDSEVNVCGIFRYKMVGGMPDNAELVTNFELDGLVNEEGPSSLLNIRNIQVLRLKVSPDGRCIIVGLIADADTISVTSGVWRSDLLIRLNDPALGIDRDVSEFSANGEHTDFDTGFADQGDYYALKRTFDDGELSKIDLTVMEFFEEYFESNFSGSLTFSGERSYSYRNGGTPSAPTELDAIQYLFYKNSGEVSDYFRAITLVKQDAIVNTDKNSRTSLFPREVGRYTLPFGGTFLSAALSQSEDALYTLARNEDGSQSIVLLSDPEAFPFIETGIRRYSPISELNPPKRLYHEYRNFAKLRQWLDIVPLIAKGFYLGAGRVRRSYDVENSVGEQLNVIGRLVVLPRSITTTTEVDYTEFGNPNDEFGADRSEFGAAFGESVVSFGEELYRTLIKAKIHKNNGDATTDSIIKACGIIVPNNQCTIIDNGDRSITIAFQNPLTEMQRLIFSNFSILPVAHGIRIASIIDG